MKNPMKNYNVKVYYIIGNVCLRNLLIIVHPEITPHYNFQQDFILTRDMYNRLKNNGMTAPYWHCTSMRSNK